MYYKALMIPTQFRLDQIDLDYVIIIIIIRHAPSVRSSACCQ